MYAHRARFPDELEILAVIVEQLCHGILRPQFLLRLQPFHVHLDVRRLLMFLRICRHTVVEGAHGTFYRCAVGKESVVEHVHLPYQVGGVRVPVWRRNEVPVLLSLVSAQQQEVFYSEKLEVEQFVFDVLDSSPAAYDVGNDRYAEPVLYRGGDGNRSRATPYAPSLEQSSSGLAVDIFAVMCGDVDVSRSELLQLLYGREQAARARAFERREHLERESAPVRAAQHFFYFHSYGRILSLLFYF